MVKVAKLRSLMVETCFEASLDWKSGNDVSIPPIQPLSPTGRNGGRRSGCCACYVFGEFGKFRFSYSVQLFIFCIAHKDEKLCIHPSEVLKNNLRESMQLTAKQMIESSPSLGQQGKRKWSRYFEKSRQSSLEHDRITDRRSSYFANSPSSTHGSLEALGPLIYTWTANNMNASAATVFCQRPKLSSRVCSSCAAVIKSAHTHFANCPEFANYMKENDWIKPGATFSCVEITGNAMEKGVRHMCSNRCFLRAFAPSREWVFFRKAVHAITDESLSKCCVPKISLCQQSFLTFFCSPLLK